MGLKHSSLSRQIAMVGLITAATAAHALEKVNLRNGFSYECTRREPIDATHVRLYLAGDADNTIDLTVSAIASIEPVADPPPAPAKAQPVAAAQPAGGSVRTFLTRAGEQHNIDVDLLASIVGAESAGDIRAVSRVGARGLMQLMPGTAREMGVSDAFQPEGNINGGTAYLDLLLTRYKDNLALALAAYNAGPAAVDRYHGIPPYRETRAYVVRVMNEFKRRKQALERTQVAHR